MTVKHLDHLNLDVETLESSRRWYREVFDFEEVESGVHQGTPWTILRAGEAMLCLYETGRRAPERGLNHFALRITEPETWVARREAAGVEVHLGPIDYPHSTSWYVMDPSGYEIEVAAWEEDSVSFAST